MSEHDEQERRKPVDYDELFPGRFIKAGLLGGRARTLTILDVSVEPLPQDNGKDRDRGVVQLRSEAGKVWDLALNSTNGQCIRAMFGRTVADWIGKRLTLVPEKDKFGREVVDAIRIAGSPDMTTETIEVEIRLPRKKPRNRRLCRTTSARQSGPGREPGDD